MHAIYSGIIIAAYLTMPAKPDAITAPMDFVARFRIASEFTMSIFWLLLGVILGGFWDKFKLHEIVKVSIYRKQNLLFFKNFFIFIDFSDPYQISFILECLRKDTRGEKERQTEMTDHISPQGYR